jgi:hypothetical protein
MNILIRVELILSCFMLGIILMFAPWSGYWEQNYFTTHYPSLIPLLLNPSTRGVISGLGVLDIILAAGMLRRRPQTAVVPPA